MSLNTQEYLDAYHQSGSKVPRVSVWEDEQYQYIKGTGLGRQLKLSLITGIPLYYSPILPGVKTAYTADNCRPKVKADTTHSFTVGLTGAMGLNTIDDLVNLPHGEINSLYLSGGTIVFEEIRKAADYTEKEMQGLCDGVYLPAVRVVFVPGEI